MTIDTTAGPETVTERVAPRVPEGRRARRGRRRRRRGRGRRDRCDGRVAARSRTPSTRPVRSTRRCRRAQRPASTTWSCSCTRTARSTTCWATSTTSEPARRARGSTGSRSATTAIPTRPAAGHPRAPLRGHDRLRHAPAVARPRRGVRRTSTPSCTAIVDPPATPTRGCDDLRRRTTRRRRARSRRCAGFVRDYIGVLRRDGRDRRAAARRLPPHHGFVHARTMLPVFSTLARQFAVYDDWHCAVPSQTFCNRSFFHASTSHGYVDNGGADGLRKWFDPRNDAPTIFNRLEDAGLSWRVYFDDRQLVSLTGFIHAPALEPYWQTQLPHDDAVLRRRRRGARLPDYAFVEPRLLYDHNDMHPPGGPMTEEDRRRRRSSRAARSRMCAPASCSCTGSTRAIRSAKQPERLERAEHDAPRHLRRARRHLRPRGSRAGRPARRQRSGGERLRLRPARGARPRDRDLGVHRPATRSSTTRCTTARVISTLARKHGLEHLTDRDRDAPHDRQRGQPRDPAPAGHLAGHPPAVPAANPRPRRPRPETRTGRSARPGVGLVGLLTARYGAPGEPVPRTYREAYELSTGGRGLFGRRPVSGTTRIELTHPPIDAAARRPHVRN